MFMCVVNLKSVNKLDLTWKQSFLIPGRKYKIISKPQALRYVRKVNWFVKKHLKRVSASSVHKLLNQNKAGRTIRQEGWVNRCAHINYHIAAATNRTNIHNRTGRTSH